MPDLRYSLTMAGLLMQGLSLIARSLLIFATTDPDTKNAFWSGRRAANPRIFSMAPDGSTNCNSNMLLISKFLSILNLNQRVWGIYRDRSMYRALSSVGRMTKRIDGIWQLHFIDARNEYWPAVYSRCSRPIYIYITKFEHRTPFEHNC